MNSIVAFISKIAKETTLLSYNAQIEASHAGDFGKGFAVIASEISDIATQTKDATTNITDIIENTSNVIAEVVSVIHDMIEGNNLIADSIQTVSAVSEEVSAHAAETTTAQEENAAILAHIDQRMQSLLKVMNE